MCDSSLLLCLFFFLMIRRPPRSTQRRSSAASDVYKGQESNQLDEIDGYSVVNLRARYQISEDLEVFANILNLFNEEYESFGLLGEEPGEVEVPIIEDFEIPVFLGAGPPRAAFIGVRYSF